MANKPLSKVLPCNLPTDWIDQQRLTSNGDIYGDERYGYIYLNEQINEIQVAVNTINNAFEDIPMTHVTSYGNHPTAVYSTSVTAPNVISTTSTSAVLIPDTAINIANPWGNANRNIQITASIQTVTYNTSSFSYTSGAAVYLVPQLTWSTTIPIAKGGTSVGTSLYALGTATLRWEASSSLASYPVSLWFRKIYDADYANILGWNMTVIQTKI